MNKNQNRKKNIKELTQNQEDLKAKYHKVMFGSIENITKKEENSEKKEEKQSLCFVLNFFNSWNGFFSKIQMKN